MANSKWDKVKQVVGTVAPGLAAGLGGPLAGAATTFILQAMGLKPDQEDQAIAALAADPNAILQLKVAEIEYQKFLKQAEIDFEKIAADDRGAGMSARAMAVAKGMWPQVALSLVYNIGYFMLVNKFIELMTAPETVHVDPWMQGTVGVLIGILSMAIPQILAFWFGSTSGSNRKNEMFNNLLQSK